VSWSGYVNVGDQADERIPARQTVEVDGQSVEVRRWKNFHHLFGTNHRHPVGDAENGQMSKSGMATLVRFGQMAKTDRCRSGPTFSSPEKSHNDGHFGPSGRVK